MTDTRTEQQVPHGIQQFNDLFSSPAMLGVLAAFIGLIFLSAIARSAERRGDKLAHGRWAGWREKDAALKAMEKETSLYIGRLGDRDCLSLPGVDMGVLVLGRTGIGKSASAIDPCLVSAIEQGFSMLVYDPSGGHQEAHAARAVSEGYQVYTIEPGAEYSDNINLLDFLEDSSDSEMAETCAAALIAAASSNNAKRDGFFGPAAIKTLKALMLLAKDSPYPDMSMVYSMLKLDKLPARINTEGANIWADNASILLNKTKETSKTSAGIEAGAIEVIERLMTRRNLEIMTGPSTCPLDLDGKKIVFLRYNEQYEDSSAPIIAALIQLFVMRNIGKHVQRKCPLLLSLDEFSSGSMYLPRIDSWANRFRKFGLITLLGVQNYGQVSNLYGKDKARALLGGYGTKIFLNPNDPETAQEIEKILGYVEIKKTNESQSRGGNSRQSSTSTHQDKAPLYPAERIQKMDRGQMIIVNPYYSSKGESNVPLMVKRVKLSDAFTRVMDQSKSKWPVIHERLIERRRKVRRWSSSSLEISIKNRSEVAEMLLPDLAKQKAKKMMRQAQQPKQSVFQILAGQSSSSASS